MVDALPGIRVWGGGQAWAAEQRVRFLIQVGEWTGYAQ